MSVYGVWKKRMEKWAKRMALRFEQEMDIPLLRDRDKHDNVKIMESFIVDIIDSDVFLLFCRTAC